LLTGLESKRDLVINQVPITTKPEVNEIVPKPLLRRVIIHSVAVVLKLLQDSYCH
jgi:hypothetical protein